MATLGYPPRGPGRAYLPSALEEQVELIHQLLEWLIESSGQN
jgi:hypothetical protein